MFRAGDSINRFLPEVIPGFVQFLSIFNLLVILRGIVRERLCRHLRFRAAAVIAPVIIAPIAVHIAVHIA